MKIKENFPEQYWHCQVSTKHGEKRERNSVINDLTFEELSTTILEPWANGQPFAIDGKLITSREDIDRIQIVHTSRSKTDYENQHNAEMQSHGIADMATDRRYLPFSRGHDYTHDFLLSEPIKSAPTRPDCKLLIQICSRLKNSARILSNRKRDKPAFTISDEYDVQDLLHSIIRSYIKHSIIEEPIGKIAGARSSRADIAIEHLGVVIEIKYAYGPDDQKRLLDDYSKDLVLYSKCKYMDDLIYFIYNSDDLEDPEAFEQLAGEKQIQEKRFNVHIVLG